MESFAAAFDLSITAFSPSPHLTCFLRGCSEHGCANTGLSPCSEPYAQGLLDHAVTNCPAISALYIFIIFKKGKCPENLGTHTHTHMPGHRTPLLALLPLLCPCGLSFWCYKFVGEGWPCFTLTLSCNRLFLPLPSLPIFFF